MTILIALVGLGLGIWVTLFLARRLDLQFDAKGDGKGNLGRRIVLILLTFLTLGIGVCGGASTIAGTADMLRSEQDGLRLGPVFVTGGILSLAIAGGGLALVFWLSRRPPKASVADEYRKDRP